MSSRFRLARPLSLLCVSALLPLSAADFHVAPDGNDAHPGTQEAPFASLAQARDAARQLAGKEAVTIHVADGIYYLPETLTLTDKDSGSGSAPILYQADNEGAAILSGGSRLKLDWQPHRDGIFKATTPAGLAIDQLFVNGNRQPMARYPDFDPAKTTDAYQGYAADAVSKERAARWANPAGGYIHAMHAQRWGGFHYRITGKNADGTPAYEGGWQNNRPTAMHPQFRMVENLFEELDAPGEWYHDANHNTLYFLPPAGLDLPTATLEAVRLRHLVELQGTRENPLRSVTLKGFVFRHAARTFMDNKEPLLRSDWTIYRGGAVLLSGIEDVHIVDCTFDQLGGNAVFVSHYARRVHIRGCLIIDPGASGICFVGDPNAVRNPLFRYEQCNDLASIDLTPGPKTDHHPADSSVDDCLIQGVGRIERQAAGVQVAMASRITIRDTSIYDCSRAGINIGDGTWGGHLIERCDVFNTVLETHDHGSFNSWGRDRYWHSNHRGVSEPAVRANPKLPFLDAVETSIIRDSRWRCDHGWDIDLDDGSANYNIYNNLLLAGGLKLREGYRRHAWNNVLVNSGFHPHVWFSDSDDRFHSNIVMAPHRGVNVPTNDVRGAEIDRNFFFGVSPAAVAENQRFGWDTSSLHGDPLFIDPAKGDFRVRDGSPAMKTGFKNFPMDQFGVKKPSLKAVARTPVMPKVQAPAGSTAPSLTARWLGATVRALTGEEFSAFGVSKEDGGIQLLDLPAQTAAAAAGLRKDDLIQSVNGEKTGTLEALAAATSRAGSRPLVIGYVRNQQPGTATITPAPATP